MKEERLLIAEAELAAWIRQRNIAIAPASPLLGLNEVESVAAGPAAIDDRMAEAIVCVAVSALEYGVRLSNPTGVVTFWFYRSDPDSAELVGHFQDADRNHLFIWANETTLRDQFYEKLLLDENTADSAVRAELTADGFVVLLALIDLWRQRTLSSILARDDRAAVRFEQTELVDCLDRTLNAGDMRWLCAMAEPACPFNLDLTQTSALRGLLELEHAGLVSTVGDLWEVTSTMDDLAAAMSVPVAIGTLFSRRFAAPPARRQLTAFRSMGRLCVAEFKDLEAPRPKVVFEDSSWPDLDLRLAELLDRVGRPSAEEPEIKEPTSPPAATAPVPGARAAGQPPPRYCTNCGREIPADQTSCGACNRPVDAPPAPGAASPPAKKRFGKFGWLIAMGVILILPFESGAKPGLLMLVGLLWGITALLRKLFRKK